MCVLWIWISKFGTTMGCIIGALSSFVSCWSNYGTCRAIQQKSGNEVSCNGSEKIYLAQEKESGDLSKNQFTLHEGFAESANKCGQTPRGGFLNPRWILSRHQFTQWGLIESLLESNNTSTLQLKRNTHNYKANSPRSSAGKEEDSQ